MTKACSLSRAGHTTRRSPSSKKRRPRIRHLPWPFPSWRRPTPPWDMTTRRNRRRGKPSELSDNLPAQDRFSSRPITPASCTTPPRRSPLIRNWRRSIPTTPMLQFALAKLYEDANNFARGQEISGQGAGFRSEITSSALLASGRVDIKSNDPQAALDPAEQGVQPGDSVRQSGAEGQPFCKPWAVPIRI